MDHQPIPLSNITCHQNHLQSLQSMENNISHPLPPRCLAIDQRWPSSRSISQFHFKQFIREFQQCAIRRPHRLSHVFCKAPPGALMAYCTLQAIAGP